MALDEVSTSENLASKYEHLLDRNYTGDPSDFLTNIISVGLDEGFQEAEPTMSNVDITTEAGTLNIPLGSINSMAEILATECARYWGATIKTSGTPVGAPNTITSVVNDAAKIISPIVSGVMALSGSKNPIEPSYYDFVKVIYDNVKTIIWTVTETTPSGVDVTYTVQVT